MNVFHNHVVRFVIGGAAEITEFSVVGISKVDLSLTVVNSGAGFLVAICKVDLSLTVVNSDAGFLVGIFKVDFLLVMVNNSAEVNLNVEVSVNSLA